MNIILINPPNTFFKKSDIYFSQCIGLLSIAAYLRDKGHNINFIDALFEGRNNIVHLPNNTLRVGLDDNSIIKRIPTDTNLIGLSIPFSHLAPICHKLIDNIKLQYADIPLVIGGIYPSTQPDLAFQSQADYIVVGEGEESINELTKYIKKDKHELPKGIISKHIKSSVENIQSAYVKDINTLPIPARDIIPFNEYIKKSPRLKMGNNRTAAIVTSRGCPYDCEFCSVHPVSGYEFRARSSQSVINEIDTLISQYKINHLEIEDDNMIFDRTRFIEILDALIERSQSCGLSWSAPNGIRMDKLDEEIIKKIALSKCSHMYIALEHGDPDVLKSMNKRLDLNKVLEVVRLLCKYNILATCFVIYGYPGETKERFENACNFYKKLKNIYKKLDFSFLIAQPFPGTKLYKRCLESKYITNDLFKNIDNISKISTAYTCYITTQDFDKEEILRRGLILKKTFSKNIYLREKIKSMIPENFIPILRSIYHKFKHK